MGAGSLHTALPEPEDTGYSRQLQLFWALFTTYSNLGEEKQKVGSNPRKTMIPKENDVISQDEQLEKGTRSTGVLIASMKGHVHPAAEFISGKALQCTNLIVALNGPFGAIHSSGLIKTHREVRKEV